MSTHSKFYIKYIANKKCYICQNIKNIKYNTKLKQNYCNNCEQLVKPKWYTI